MLGSVFGVIGAILLVTMVFVFRKRLRRLCSECFKPPPGGNHFPLQPLTHGSPDTPVIGMKEPQPESCFLSDFFIKQESKMQGMRIKIVTTFSPSPPFQVSIVLGPPAPSPTPAPHPPTELTIINHGIIYQIVVHTGTCMYK